MRWLVSDWDHRDPRDDFHDIDTGNYLTELTNMPGSIRQMLEDNSMFVNLAMVGDKYVVSTIVKKREAEFQQGTDSYFVYDKYGAKIALSEEEYDKLLGIEHNPDDVYNHPDVDLETLDSDHSAPKEVWDVVYDASAYISTAQRLTGNYEWQQSKSVHEKVAELTAIADGEHPDYPNSYIYSADWFPYPAYGNRFLGYAAEVAVKVRKGCTKAELARLVYPRPDKRPDMIKKLTADIEQARKAGQGVRLSALLKKREALQSSYLKDQERGFNKPKLHNNEISKLWNLWEETQLKLHGVVQLPKWKIDRMLKRGAKRAESRGFEPPPWVDEQTQPVEHVEETANPCYLQEDSEESLELTHAHQG